MLSLGWNGDDVRIGTVVGPVAVGDLGQLRDRDGVYVGPGLFRCVCIRRGNQGEGGDDDDQNGGSDSFYVDTPLFNR